MAEQRPDRREREAVPRALRIGRVARSHAVEPLFLKPGVEQVAADQCLDIGGEILGRGDGVTRGPAPRRVQVRDVVRFQGARVRGRDLVVGQSCRVGCGGDGAEHVSAGVWLGQTAVVGRGEGRCPRVRAVEQALLDSSVPVLPVTCSMTRPASMCWCSSSSNRPRRGKYTGCRIRSARFVRAPDPLGSSSRRAGTLGSQV